MTEAREISKERLEEIQNGHKATAEWFKARNERVTTDRFIERADLLAHIAFQQAALEAASARVAELEANRWTPVGDNHHNAAMCPHCNPAYGANIARATASSAEAARLLGVQGLLRTNLERVTEHLESWRRESPTEATSETDAALWCAREVLKALAPPGVSGGEYPPFEPNAGTIARATDAALRDSVEILPEPPPAPAPEPASTEAWLAACIVFPTDGPKALHFAHALDRLRGRG